MFQTAFLFCLHTSAVRWEVKMAMVTALQSLWFTGGWLAGRSIEVMATMYEKEVELIAGSLYKLHCFHYWEEFCFLGRFLQYYLQNLVTLIRVNNSEMVMCVLTKCFLSFFFFFKQVFSWKMSECLPIGNGWHFTYNHSYLFWVSLLLMEIDLSLNYFKLQTLLVYLQWI